MSNKIAVVVPALEENRYSPHGDLAKFGDSTLLEWKIIQLLKVFDKEKIYVSTPSKKIKDITKNYGINCIDRNLDANIPDMIHKCAKTIKDDHLLWTNTTLPFIGPAHYSRMIEKYLTINRKRYDSIVAVLKIQEFMMYKGEPLNFDIKKSESRKDINPVYKITTGCSILPKEVCFEHKKDIGFQPSLYEVDSFTAMEISGIEDLTMLNNMVAEYFRRELKVNTKEMWKE